MPVPSSISDLSQTAGSNSPAGSESPTTADDYLRQLSAFIAQLRDGKGFSSESDVASGATTDIGAANTFMVRVTGTTNITSLGTNYSAPRFLRFAGALTLTHHATNLILPNSTDLTTSAGFTCIAVPVGNPASGWQILATQDSGWRPGDIKMTGSSTLPGGWLVCDGSAVSRTTYAALFAAIGTSFGTGDGSTTFNLPPHDRMPIGAGNLYAIGATGGSKDAIAVSHSHTYSGTTGGQSATHTHGVTDPGHTHAVNTVVGTAGATTALQVSAPSSNEFPTTRISLDGAATGISIGNASADHSHNYSGTTSTDGSSGTNANLPPYVGVRFIIKT